MKPKLPCQMHDPEMWWPIGKSVSSSTEVAKALCHGCPIKIECLQIALVNGEVGVWGGTTEQERHTWLRQHPTWRIDGNPEDRATLASALATSER